MKVKSVLLVLTRTIVSQTLGLLRSFLIIPFLSVGEFGIYRYIISVLGYANYFNLGTVALLGFKYPFYDGAGKKVEAENLQYLVRTTVLLGCCIFLIFLVVFFFDNPSFTTTERIVLVVICCFMSLVPYFSMYYRTRFDYQKMVKRDLLVAVLSFLLFLGFGLHWGLAGFIIGYASMGLISTLINWKTLRGGTHQLDWPFVKANFKFSILLAASGVINQFMITGDILLLKNIEVLDSEGFGTYTFCAMIAALVPSYIGALSDVNTQELLRFLGEQKLSSSEADRGELVVRKLESLILRDFVTAIVLAAIVFLITNVAVFFFFPKYIMALEVLGVFMIGSIVLRWRTYPVVFMNHLQKTSLVNFSSFLSLGLMVGYIGCLVLLKSTSIYSLAWVSFISYLVCAIVSMAFIFRYYNQSKHFLPFLRRLILFLVPCFLFALPYFIKLENAIVLNLLSIILIPVTIFLLLRFFLPLTYLEVKRTIVELFSKIRMGLRTIKKP